jgi:response regulator RpfG family c-di-GMP phosphodiesterase
MNGVEMLDRLKGDADLRNIPVIMLTAESGKDNVLNIVKKGIRDYMVKPFKGEDLLERIRKILPLEPRPDGQSPENKAGRYFSQIEDIVVLRLPAKVARPVAVEVEGSLQRQIKEMAAAHLKKMILDMRGAAETNVSLIKLIITVFQHCQKANIAVKLVASPQQGEELKGFQETSQITAVNSIEEAKAVL